jgi:DNA-binding IclR family transcriptional regulator
VSEALLSALGDRYARLILLALMESPRSPLELSSELGIPQATVYRKLRMLEELGLVERDGLALSRSTLRWSCRYRAVIRRAVVTLSPSGIAVEVEALKGKALS